MMRITRPQSSRDDADDMRQELRLRLGPKRLASHQQFIEGHAQGENVAAAIYAMPFDKSLLWRHVGGRPSVLRSFTNILFLKRQSEIDHERLAARVQED